MTARRALLACSALAAVPVLGGCVAAVAAIPAMASGAIVATGGDGIGKRKPVDRAVTTPIPPFEQRQPVAPNAGPAIVLTDMTSLPPPSNEKGHGSASTGFPLQGGEFGRFTARAVEQSAADSPTTGRTSAILANSLELEPELTDCGTLAPVVLLDLDPAGSVFQAYTPHSAMPGLAVALQDLRNRDVGVFWISDASAALTPRIRKHLVESGLDPAGNDRLLLAHGDEDRKQVRREALSEAHCVIAIAGDTKSDFDELYDYLKTPEAGANFDALIGQSWFLTPLPLEHTNSGETE